MKFPSMALQEVESRNPLLELPEITLRAAAIVPPMVVPIPGPISIPTRFATAAVPVGLVPTRLPPSWPTNRTEREST